MKKFLIIFALFLFFFWFYSRLIKVPPVDYWDEHWWIGRSYFFELSIRGDFTNHIWKEYYSYDQPKLAEYLNGLLFYPTYLKEKRIRGKNYDFTKYLIDHNFFSIEGEKYFKYKNSLKNFINWETNVGYYYVKSLKLFGSGFQKTLSFIFASRLLSGFLLALSVITIFLLTNEFFQPTISLIISGLYSFNTVLVFGGLKVTSEALFIMLFNFGLYLLIKLFSRKKKSLSLLLLFSIRSEEHTS